MIAEAAEIERSVCERDENAANNEHAVAERDKAEARVAQLEKALRVIRGSAELRPDGTTVREIDEVIKGDQ